MFSCGLVDAAKIYETELERWHYHPDGPNSPAESKCPSQVRGTEKSGAWRWSGRRMNCWAARPRCIIPGTLDLAEVVAFIKVNSLVRQAVCFSDCCRILFLCPDRGAPCVV